MRKSSIAGLLLATAAAALVVAGPVMIYEGVHGQNQVRAELTAQKITFPAQGSESLPANLADYAGVTVTTGPQAKAYADMVETHVQASTGGKTYSEVSGAWIAGGMKDATLAQQRQTAFMGESLRASLMSAYQAWMLGYLAIGLGALLTFLSAVFGFTAYALQPARIKVPASPEVLEHEKQKI
ncbi:hypothetical protein [Hamadaea tsunoensis]|uniref:hypothetical protein n=1 Tax=Hamadaea tsunoensis TaxID=53368 RepID=UPI00048584EE|nr:hypothetical protein [Hamadaea tsunoensis]